MVILWKYHFSRSSSLSIFVLEEPKRLVLGFMRFYEVLQGFSQVFYYKCNMTTTISTLPLCHCTHSRCRKHGKWHVSSFDMQTGLLLIISFFLRARIGIYQQKFSQARYKKNWGESSFCPANENAEKSLWVNPCCRNENCWATVTPGVVCTTMSGIVFRLILP